jgi:hypothetical protein
MSQAGYTPIKLYSSTTHTNQPAAGDLATGELAINTYDGKLFYKDPSNNVQLLAMKLNVSSATTTTSPWAWNSDYYAEYALNALDTNLTISADAGSPVDGQTMLFRIKDDGTSRTLTWTTGSSKSFREVGAFLPTSTVANKTVYVGCVYNTNASRWDVVATSQEI